MFWNELRRKEINMTKEQIEKAAAIYTAQAEESDYAEVRDVKRAFADGANWYINSVWHDASERPKDRNAQCLVEVKSGGSSFFLLSQFYHSGGFSFMDGINKIQPKRWAYIEDLLPNKEIKSIENEKDNV
jgi:hypothetical protein